MSDSHHPPDTTRQCCLCRVGRCELSLETVWWQSLNSWPIDHPRRVAFRSIGLVICNSPQRVYNLRRGQRRCLWAVAEAVDRQARQSCLVLSGLAMWVDRRTSAFCVGVRLAVALRRPTHSDTDQTQNAPAWLSGRLSSHRHTTHDKTVLSVSCLAWRCELRAFRRPAAVSFYPRIATLVRY